MNDQVTLAIMKATRVQEIAKEVIRNGGDLQEAKRLLLVAQALFELIPQLLEEQKREKAAA